MIHEILSLLQKVKNETESPDWDVSIFDIHLRKIICVYCPGHAVVNENDETDRLAGKATIAAGLCLGDLKC